MISGAWRTLALCALASALLVSGCIYPRRSTSLAAVRGAAASSTGVPSGVVSLTVVSAQTAAERRGLMSWDEGGGLPDCFVRVYRNEELIFETPTVNDSLSPVFDATMPESFSAPSGARIRFEVWDRDVLGADPVGIYRGVGLPSRALPGADARVLLDGGSYLTVRVGLPRPYRGVGISLFEIRPGELVVVEVEPYSPAGRAGIVSGDRIVAIGGRDVSSLTASTATGALSMAADRREMLRLRNGAGDERVVELDRGYTYLVH